MSFSTLPQELIDLIVYRVKLSAYSTDLAKLCLVSQQTLYPAQRALYEEPFLELKTWKNARGFGFRAKRLLASLQATNGQLGRLVRNTQDLYNAVWLWKYMKDDEEMEEEEEEGTTAKIIEAWYLDVLRACPNLQTVVLFCWSNRVLELSLQAIAASISTIQQVKCRDDDLSNGAEGLPHLSTAFSLFRLYLHRPLSLLEFSPSLWSRKIPAPTFTLPLETKGLSLHLFPSHIDRIFEYFPSPLPSTPLEKIDLTLLGTSASTTTLPLASISEHFGKNVNEFVVAHLDLPRHAHAGLYGHFHAGTPLPPHSFRNFTRLEILELSGFRGPTNEFLEALGDYTPLLRRIDLNRSVWISSSNQTSIVPEEVFPEHKVVESLSRFKRLRFVHLGILPTKSHERYAWITDEMENLGVAVEFEICS